MDGLRAIFGARFSDAEILAVLQAVNNDPNRAADVLLARMEDGPPATGAARPPSPPPRAAALAPLIGPLPDDFLRLRPAATVNTDEELALLLQQQEPLSAADRPAAWPGRAADTTAGPAVATAAGRPKDTVVGLSDAVALGDSDAATAQPSEQKPSGILQQVQRFGSSTVRKLRGFLNYPAKEQRLRDDGEDEDGSEGGPSARDRPLDAAPVGPLPFEDTDDDVALQPLQRTLHGAGGAPAHPLPNPGSASAAPSSAAAAEEQLLAEADDGPLGTTARAPNPPPRLGRRALMHHRGAGSARAAAPPKLQLEESGETHRV